MEEAHLFLDTNLFLHFRPLEIEWRNYVDAKRVFLHVAQPVLDEISVIKDMGEPKSVRKRAAKVSKRLLDLFDKANPHQLRDGEFLVLEAETPRLDKFPKLNPSSKDDQLIAAALTFGESCSGKPYIVTADLSLALRVKIRQWPLEHLTAPEEFRLQEEPDDSEREMAKLQQELAILKNAQPQLRLSFQDGKNVFHLTGGHFDATHFVAEKMAEVRAKHPKLKVPKFDNSTKGALGKAALYHLGETPETIQSYNSQLDDYFSLAEKWMQEVTAIGQRTHNLKIHVSNSGTAPADSVHLKLHFPECVQVVETEDTHQLWPQQPSPPRKPGISEALANLQRFGSGPSTYKRALRHSLSESSGTLSFSQSNGYDVVWESVKLRQHSEASIAPLNVVYKSGPISFEILYELRADNLPNVIRGSLYVAVPQLDSPDK